MLPPVRSTKLSIIYVLKFNKTSDLDSISIVHMNGGYTRLQVGQSLAL